MSDTEIEDTMPIKISQDTEKQKEQRNTKKYQRSRFNNSYKTLCNVLNSDPTDKKSLWGDCDLTNMGCRVNLISSCFTFDEFLNFNHKNQYKCFLHTFYNIDESDDINELGIGCTGCYKTHSNDIIRMIAIILNGQYKSNIKITKKTKKELKHETEEKLKFEKHIQEMKKSFVDLNIDTTDKKLWTSTLCKTEKIDIARIELMYDKTLITSSTFDIPDSPEGLKDILNEIAHVWNLAYDIKGEWMNT